MRPGPAGAAPRARCCPQPRRSPQCCRPTGRGQGCGCGCDAGPPAHAAVVGSGPSPSQVTLPKKRGNFRGFRRPVFSDFQQRSGSGCQLALVMETKYPGCFALMCGFLRLWPLLQRRWPAGQDLADTVTRPISIHGADRRRHRQEVGPGEGEGPRTLSVGRDWGCWVFRARTWPGVPMGHGHRPHVCRCDSKRSSPLGVP